MCRVTKVTRTRRQARRSMYWPVPASGRRPRSRWPGSTLPCAPSAPIGCTPWRGVGGGSNRSPGPSVQSRAADVNESATEDGGAVGEGALLADVLGAALGGFHPDRREAQPGEVVRAGAHVEGADLAGQVEAVGDQLARGERGQLVGPS